MLVEEQKQLPTEITSAEKRSTTVDFPASTPDSSLPVRRSTRSTKAENICTTICATEESQAAKLETRVGSKGIVSWPEDERPRERLLSHGPQALTDAELIAILIRVGFRGTSAVELGRQILGRFGSLRAIVEAPVLALLDIKGLKGAKASQLVAAMELARRVAVPPKRKQLRIKSSSVAMKYLRERMRALPNEQFRALYLNRRGALLDDTLITEGVVDAVRPSLRTIIARALQTNASALIAAHNHPSGEAEPSESDRLLTQDLIMGLRPVGVKVLDHIIVAEGGAFSFADSGLLDELELTCLAPGNTMRWRLSTRGNG